MDFGFGPCARAIGPFFLACGLAACASTAVTTVPVAQTATVSSSLAGVGDAALVYSVLGAPGATFTLSSSATASGGITPADVRSAKALPNSASVFYYLTLTVNRTVPASILLREQVTFSGALPAGVFAAEFDDPSAASPALATIAGTVAGKVVTYENSTSASFEALALQANHPYVFQFYTTPAVTPSPSPSPSLSPSPSPMPTTTATPSPTPSPSPSPSPTPTPTPGSVVLASATLAFLNIGSGFAQTSTVSQAAYGGAFTIGTTTCAGIASAVISGTTITVTPLGAGSCTYTVSGGSGQSSPLAIGVTTATVGGS